MFSCVFNEKIDTMNRFIYICILVIFCVSITKAQKSYVGVNGATIKVTSDANITIHGDFNSKDESKRNKSYIKMDGNFTISGDITNDSFNLFDEYSSGLFHFIGNEEQYITGDNAIYLPKINVDKVATDPTEKPRLFIESPVIVTQEVKLSSGIVDIGEDDLSIGGKCNVIRSTDGSGCFFDTNKDGALVKSLEFGTDPSTTINMPIGANGQYSPVAIRFEDLMPLNDNAKIRFKAKGERQPNMPTDGNFLNRYWIVENSDISEETKYNLTFYYNQADVSNEEIENTFEGIEMKEKEGFLMPFNTLEKVDAENNRFYVNTTGQMKVFTAGDMRSATFSDVIVFPNPSDGHFSIKIDNPNDKYMKYEFYNIFGQVILSGTTERGVFKYNFSKFPKGVYFYKIYFSKKTISRKITIK